MSKPADFVSAVHSQVNTSAFGYKIFPEHIPNDKVPDILSHNETCIIYKRENITAQYMSLKRAVKYNCWHTTGGPKCHNLHVEFSQSEFMDFKHKYATWYRLVEDACKGHRIVRCTMEEHLRTRDTSRLLGG